VYRAASTALMLVVGSSQHTEAVRSRRRFDGEFFVGTLTAPLPATPWNSW